MVKCYNIKVFEDGEIIQVNPRQPSNTVYKIGFSIGEKDYKGWNDYDEQDNPSGVERINFHNIPIRIGGKADQDGNETQRGEQIQIGRTYMYEPVFLLSNLRIAFPKGCPKSTLIEIVTMKLEE